MDGWREKIGARRIVAIILCAGSGSRTGLAYNKILHYIGTKTAVETAVEKFAGIADRILCVCAECDAAAIADLLKNENNITFCVGGATRSQSVRNALSALDDETDIVIIHDGARPFVSPAVLASSVESAILYGSGIAAVAAIDAVKVAADGVVRQSLDKSTLFNVQTPQTFRRKEICDAYARVAGDFGDDCEVYQLAGYTPRLVESTHSNTKITTPADLLKISGESTNIGVGFDVHAMQAGRKLIIGGVDIPYELGLDGHSDADVLVHAVMDALLSAAGLPDIGVLFPDTDEKFLGANSIVLLRQVAARVTDAGYSVGNISAVVMCQKPKLAVHIPVMRQNISAACGIDVTQINVSATTTEKLGIVGEGKGIAASCSCLLRKL